MPRRRSGVSSLEFAAVATGVRSAHQGGAELDGGNCISVVTRDEALEVGLAAPQAVLDRADESVVADLVLHAFGDERTLLADATQAVQWTAGGGDGGGASEASDATNESGGGGGVGASGASGCEAAAAAGVVTSDASRAPGVVASRAPGVVAADAGVTAGVEASD